MPVLVSSPDWFLGFDSILEFITTVIAFFIGYYSYKVFRINNERKYFYLGFSFFAIALSFLSKALTNIAIYLELIRKVDISVKLLDINFMYKIGFIVHIALILIAYITLVALSLKIKDMRVISLFVVTAVLATIIGSSSLLLFQVISLIFLLYVIPYFYRNYTNNKNANSLIVLISFLLIALSHLFYILLFTGANVFYVYGSVAQLLGYIGLLTNLVWCLKYG
ncbi:MAG: hypothetical protein AABW87_00355 [Nanoarchaeota archaeon]